MSLKDVIKKFDKGLCRCCHAEGIFHDLSQPRFILDQKEVYSEMLKDSFNVDMKPLPGPFCNMTYSICDSCILRLRDAANFKHQVQLCEKKLREYYSVYEAAQSSKSENNKGETSSYSFLRDALLESSGTTRITEIKLEDSDDERPIKKESLTDDEDDDQDMEMTFDDDDDDDDEEDFKPIIEMKRIKLDEKKKTGTKTTQQSSPTKKPASQPSPKSKVTQKVQVKPASKTQDPNTSVSETKKLKDPKIVKPKFFLRDEDYRQEGDVYHCTRCDKNYHKIISLRDHVKTKHFSIPKFVCSYCKQGFMTPAPLAIHKLQVHNVDERYNCNACDSVFNTKIQLRKHINNFHMLGEKYKCDSCEYESYSFESMYKHKFKHRTQKDFHCRFCRKSFLRKATLDLHERIHTGDRRKVCKVCGQAFVQKASLNYHMTKYHPEVNF